MKTNRLTVLLAVGFFLSGCVLMEDLGGFARQQRLEGTWYLNGARDKRCEIVSTRDGFEARNERGETTPLVYDRYGSVRAVNWEGGLRGELRGDRIEWANGTTWTRVASR